MRFPERPLARFGAPLLVVRAAVSAGSLGAAAPQAAALEAPLPPASSRATRAPTQQPVRPDGRDPFRPPERAGPEERPPGLAGVRIVEASVRGILRRPEDPEDAEAPDRPARGGSVILEAPDGRGFVASPGAELLDGVLVRVEEDGAVFRTNRRPANEIFRPLSTEGPAAPPPDPRPDPP